MLPLSLQALSGPGNQADAYISPLSRLYLASISPRPCLYLASTSPPPRLYLASTSPVSRLYLASISPISRLYLASISPPPRLYLASTSPVSRLYLASISPISRIYLSCISHLPLLYLPSTSPISPLYRASTSPASPLYLAQAFKRAHRLGSVNSVNVARLLVQVQSPRDLAMVSPRSPPDLPLISAAGAGRALQIPPISPRSPPTSTVQVVHYFYAYLKLAPAADARIQLASGAQNGRLPCRTTPPYMPARCLLGLRPILRPPERRLSILEARRTPPQS